MAGRKPKPAAVHKANGNPSKLNLKNFVEPIAEGDLNEPPEGLTASQIKDWHKCIKYAPAGVLKLIDGDVLRNYVINNDIVGRLNAELRAEESLLLFNEKGESKLNPLLTGIRNHSLTVRSLATELGFTPAARARLAAPEGDDKENEFMNLQAPVLATKNGERA